MVESKTVDAERPQGLREEMLYKRLERRSDHDASGTETATNTREVSDLSGVSAISKNTEETERSRKHRFYVGAKEFFITHKDEVKMVSVTAGLAVAALVGAVVFMPIMPAIVMAQVWQPAHTVITYTYLVSGTSTSATPWLEIVPAGYHTAIAGGLGAMANWMAGAAAYSVASLIVVAKGIPKLVNGVYDKLNRLTHDGSVSASSSKSEG